MTQSEQKVKILEAVKLRPGISNISDTLLSDFISLLSDSGASVYQV
ncbi:hypothetical protein GCM10008903_08790 [Clostridium cadaveris]